MKTPAKALSVLSTSDQLMDCKFVTQKRLDWGTLTAPTTIDSHEEMEKLLYVILSYFPELTFKVKILDKHMSAQAESFYVRVLPFCASIQVRGAFFVLQDDAYKKFRTIAAELSFLIKEHLEIEDPNFKMHLSRTDICQDFGSVVAPFRDPIVKKHSKNFKAKYASFIDMARLDPDEWIDTGYLLKGNSSEFSCYRVDVANEDQKNKDKKLKMLKLIEGFGPITRFEVRLTTKNACLFATYLLYRVSNESEFCRLVLAEFYPRHAWRIPNPSDSHKNRWEHNQFWKSLFIVEGQTFTFAELTGQTRDKIRLNDKISQRNLTRAYDSAFDIIRKMSNDNPDIIDNIANIQLARAKRDASKKDKREESIKNATKEFYRRLSESDVDVQESEEDIENPKKAA